MEEGQEMISATIGILARCCGSLSFSPKYREKVLNGEGAEEIIREICKELNIEIIDMADKK